MLNYRRVKLRVFLFFFFIVCTSKKRIVWNEVTQVCRQKQLSVLLSSRFWWLRAWKLLFEEQRTWYRWDPQVRLWFCIYRYINYIWHTGAHVWHVGVVMCPDVADLKSHLRRGWAQKVLHEPEGMCQNKRAAKSLKTLRSLSGLVCKKYKSRLLWYLLALRWELGGLSA